MKKNGGAKHKKKDDKPQKQKKDDTATKRNRNNKHGNGTDAGSEVYISKVKTPYNSSSGEYRLSFISGETTDELMIGVKISSDDDSLMHAEITSAVIDGNKLSIKNGMISIGAVSKNEKKTLTIKLSEIGRMALEGRAYAKS